MDCPHAALDPLSPEYLANPYQRFDDLRRDTPVFHDDDLGYFVVARYADIERVFRDPELFSASNAQDPVFPLHTDAGELLKDVGFRKIRTMTNLDGPEHSRIRRHNQVGFSPRRLRALEPIIRATAASLLDAFESEHRSEREGDLVAGLSFPLPATIIFSLLGFPPEDTEVLKSWCANRMSFSWGRPSADEQTKIANDMIAYWSYCEAHIQRRLREPADDFTSDLLAVHLEDPATLSTDEIAHVVYGLSFAGHETTTNLISNAVRSILQSDSWKILRQENSLIGAAVDETLRFDSSVISWRRQTTEATMLGGVDIPAGAKLLLLLGSANFDESEFTNPDVFDLHRMNANRHLSFGFGKHYCLGATLAKVETSVVLEELIRRFPLLEMVDNQSFSFHPNVTFRGPQQLRVAW